MKRIICCIATLLFFTTGIAATTATAPVDPQSCESLMVQPNTKGQTYNADACACIWKNIMAGCLKVAPSAFFCHGSLYNKMNSASDDKITSSYCKNAAPVHAKACVDEVKYFRAPGNGTDGKFTAHNCPCPAGVC